LFAGPPRWKFEGKGKPKQQPEGGRGKVATDSRVKKRRAWGKRMKKNLVGEGEPPKPGKKEKNVEKKAD